MTAAAASAKDDGRGRLCTPLAFWPSSLSPRSRRRRRRRHSGACQSTRRCSRDSGPPRGLPRPAHPSAMPASTTFAASSTLDFRPAPAARARVGRPSVRPARQRAARGCRTWARRSRALAVRDLRSRAPAEAGRQPHRRHGVELRPGGADGADDSAHRFPAPGRRPRVWRLQQRPGLAGPGGNRSLGAGRRTGRAPRAWLLLRRRTWRATRRAVVGLGVGHARFRAGALGRGQRNLARTSPVDQRGPGVDAVARRLAARAQPAAATPS